MDCEVCKKDIQEAKFRIVPAQERATGKKVNIFLTICLNCISQNKWENLAVGEVKVIS